MTIETTEDIRVENLTVTEDAVATRLNVPESASVNTLAAAEINVRNLNVNQDTNMEILTVAEDATIENLTVVENAEVENINVLGEAVTGRLEVYESASINALAAADATINNLTRTDNLIVTNAAEVENLTVTGDTIATRATVHDSAYINSLYVDGIKCGEPRGFAPFSAPGQLWTETLYADTIRGDDITLKGGITMEDGYLTASGGPVTILGELLNTGGARFRGGVRAAEFACSGNVAIEGDLKVTGMINNDYRPVISYMAPPSENPEFDPTTAFEDLISNLIEAGIMAPAPEPTDET